MVCAYACVCECWVLVDAEVYWSQRRVNHSYPHVNKDTLWPLSEWITTKFHYFTSYQTISFITTPLLPPWLSCGISQDVATCRLHCLSFNNTKRFTSHLLPSTTTSLFSPSVTMVIIEIITSYLVPYWWLTTILAHKSRTMRKILKWYFFSIKMWNQWE